MNIPNCLNIYKKKRNPNYEFPDTINNNDSNTLKLYTYDNSKKILKNKKNFICGGCKLTFVYEYLNILC